MPPCYQRAGVIGLSLPGFWGVWAAATRVDSSWTPHGSRSPSRPRPEMRLRCAKSISTFFRLFWAVGLKSDAEHWWAKSLTISNFSRWTEQTLALESHFSFNLHPVQPDFSTRYLRAFQIGTSDPVRKSSHHHVDRCPFLRVELTPDAYQAHNRTWAQPI
jgi:hypothetical protein